MDPKLDKLAWNELSVFVQYGYVPMANVGKYRYC